MTLLHSLLTPIMFRDTPNSGGSGVPRSASSYSVQAPDMEDVKESVRQVLRFEACKTIFKTKNQQSLIV